LKAGRAVEIVGVEADPGYAAAAGERLDRVVESDLEALVRRDDLEAELGTFDCLIAGDVLEHLRDPWEALRACAALLRPGGTAIVSLPNARFWETLWQLGVRGTWPRRGEGIFDRDHLRWFTAADGLALVRDAGLEPQTIDRQYRFSPRGSRLDRFAHLFGRTPLRPFLTFQFLIVAHRP
jgi:SAM-dependent methyltransferase